MSEEDNLDGKNNISKVNISNINIVYHFRNKLSNLLGTLKLNYNFYQGTRQNLNIIIYKLEGLILSLYNSDKDNLYSKEINSINNKAENIDLDNTHETELFELYKY